MFFITIHTKMAANRRCTNDIQNEEEGESFIEQIFVENQTNVVFCSVVMENIGGQDCQRDTSNITIKVSRAVRSNHLQKQPMVDVIVASIAIPLLVIFSLMLHNSMRRDWIHDFDARWRILGLGLSLLFISSVVCLYVTHRLGFCIWAVQQQREINRVAEHRRRLPVRESLPAPLTSAGSQLHLMVNGELPPSYDSVMRNPIQPPPYFSVIICDEKAESERYIAHSQARYNTRSVNVPDVHQSPTS